MSNIGNTHIPYKGASTGMIDLVGGQVQLAWISLPAALPFVKQ